MTMTQVLPRLVAKEIRALLPAWLWCMALVAAGAGVKASGIFSDDAIHDLAILAFTTASVALGALSVGHEYAGRTLSLLLSQPVGRAPQFLAKQSVLAVMLAILAVTAWSTALVQTSDVAAFVVLAAFGGLCVAPLMTMVCRGPLGGAVLSAPTAGWAWLLIDLFVSPPLKVAVFSWTVVGLCAICAVLGWRAFMRLEAIEGRGGDLRWPSAAGSVAPARTGAPVWRLVKKELGLQVVTFGVAGAYVFGWLVVMVLERVTGESGEHPFGAATFLYSAQLAVLAGALASAEERHLGTLAWQGLLPMASWKQWAVKVGVVLTLSTLLAVGLPALVVSIHGAAIRIDGGYAAVVLLLSVVGLYVSSLSATGLRALLLSLPVSLVLIALLIGLSTRGQLSALELALPAVPALVALYFAQINHGTSEPGAKRIWVQLFCLAGSFAFCAAVVAVALR